MLRWRGIKCDPTAVIYPGTKIFPGIQIDKGCFISIECMLDTSAPIILEENVHLAGRVSILTATHDEGPDFCRAGRAVAKPVIIKRGSWIGSAAIINPGVTINAGCIIASGSVVTKDTAPNGVYAGVPARWIRDCFDGPLPSHLS